MKLINDNAPRAVKEKDIKNFFGQKVAVDASMSLYQFLVSSATSLRLCMHYSYAPPINWDQCYQWDDSIIRI
jgi:5'-3' exonuclease